MTNRRVDGHPRSRIHVGAGRETDLRRRTDKRPQLEAVLIATNGRCTERMYFTKLRQEPWVNAGRIAVVFEAGAPLAVVEGAARRRDRDDFDQAWAVCDVDRFSTESATQTAGDVGVQLAWSNPCFEVWLLLHLRAWTRYIEDAQHADDAICRHIGDWDKTNLNFAAFRDGVEDAIERAKGLGEPPAANPSSSVWRLVEALK